MPAAAAAATAARRGSCHFLRVFTSRARIHALAAARAESCPRVPRLRRADVLAILLLTPHDPGGDSRIGVRESEDRVFPTVVGSADVDDARRGSPVNTHHQSWERLRLGKYTPRRVRRRHGGLIVRKGNEKGECEKERELRRSERPEGVRGAERELGEKERE